MDKLRELIFTALGAASVCWKGNEVPSGEFDSQTATNIGNQLIEDIMYLLETPIDHD